MRPYVVLHKPRGKTPLEVVNAWKEEQNLSNDFPVAYAGRLDPMAEGKLLILLSDECKRQKEYTNLDKEYVVEVLFDISTDTGDVLGHPMLQKTRTTIQRKELASALMKEHGTHEREYPVFSSKTVSGKPLFLYALEETLDTITIPTHSETIYKTSALEIASLSSEQLQARINDALSVTPTSDEPSKALGADFRIGTIAPQWIELFENAQDRTFTVATLRVTCGSGTYMRTLAARIGESLDTTACALSIDRTKIGTYQPLPFGLGFWKKEYR